MRADLTANGTPIDDVPLVVLLGGQRLGQAEPSTGTLATCVTIPASVPAGERTLRVRLPFEERVLAGVSAATTVTVVEVDPELALTATRTGERQLTVDGVLEANGDAVANESIQLRADGSPIATTTTDETGSFDTSVIVSESIADGTVPVTAIYDGTGSNLGATRAATTVEFPAGSETAAPSWAWICLAAVAVGALVGVAYLIRRSSAPPPPTRPAESAVPAAEPRPSPEPAPPPLLEPATDRLVSGRPNAAITACYAALRERLAARIDASSALTHWEFHHRCLAQTDDDVDEALQTVTEGYERARFDPAGVSESEAEAVLEHAEQLYETTDVGSTPASADD